ncbi:hypothetical protein F383_35785 [Gossypium arboreum]|uniref:Uncharacterized protein n=1 Tax=Gossypium arboreum TaxID=29729 RepID=A0A0B0N6Y9_GOSAR|nr:hypothetical protein F383_35785 [Gossypium arboreum]
MFGVSKKKRGLKEQQ